MLAIRPPIPVRGPLVRYPMPQPDVERGVPRILTASSNRRNARRSAVASIPITGRGGTMREHLCLFACPCPRFPVPAGGKRPARTGLFSSASPCGSLPAACPHNTSSSSSRHSIGASQQAPHCRGRLNRNSASLTRTMEASASSPSQRSSGNSDRVCGRVSPSSKTSIDRRQANSGESFISPSNSTWRCTTRPPATRVFSTMLQ